MRAVVVAASPLARAGLESILNERGVDVVRSASIADFLAGRVARADAGVIVMDASGEPLHALLASIGHVELSTESAIVLLANQPTAGRLSEAVRAGVGAILRADAPPGQLMAAIEAVAAGLIVMDRGEIDSVFAASARASRPLVELAESLTPREREVLKMLASGLGNKEIAARMLISEHTVKFHVSSILGKLGASSRTEAVALGIRHGLLLL